MGYSDFPFDATFPGSTDSRRFCCHGEVLAYLEAFAAQYGLKELVRFETEVLRVSPLSPTIKVHDSIQHGVNGMDTAAAKLGELELCHNGQTSRKWAVTSRDRAGTQNSVENVTEVFDAIVVCNGHYSEPLIPVWPGKDVFPGLQMHSHNYRRPDEFVGKTVIVVGAAFSGTDISYEIVEAGASAVYLSARSWVDPLSGARPGDGPGDANADEEKKAAIEIDSADRDRPPNHAAREAIRVGNVVRLESNGSVMFEGGITVEGVDAIIYATGYLYSFPFLEGTDAAPVVENNRVGPLYGHVFPPAWAPTLSFVGLPWKVVPFPQFELQSKWIARCLSGRCPPLPSEKAMLDEVENRYDGMAREGRAMRYTHRMEGELQSEYNSWLARCAGETAEEGWPIWRSTLYSACGASRRQNGMLFRDLPLIGAEEALKEAAEAADRARAAQTLPVN